MQMIDNQKVLASFDSINRKHHHTCLMLQLQSEHTVAKAKLNTCKAVARTSLCLRNVASKRAEIMCRAWDMENKD